MMISSFARAALALAFASLVAGCATSAADPKTEAGVAGEECKVTGSNLPRKNTSCADAARQAGVVHAAPTSLEASQKSPMKGPGN